MMMMAILNAAVQVMKCKRLFFLALEHSILSTHPGWEGSSPRLKGAIDVVVRTLPTLGRVIMVISIWPKLP